MRSAPFTIVTTSAPFDAATSMSKGSSPSAVASVARQGPSATTPAAASTNASVVVTGRS